MKKAILAAILSVIILCAVAHAEESGAYSITMTENRTTGYSWSYAIGDDTVLAISDDGFQARAGSEMLLGAPGMHTWTVTGRKAGIASVTFTYTSEWGPQADDPVVVFSFASSAAGAITLVSTEGFPEQYMPDMAIIRLVSNETTGYSWKAEADPKGILAYASDEYDPDATSADVVGAGGVHTWVFSVESSGTVVLTFQYLRSSDPEGTPAATLKLTYFVDTDRSVALMGIDGDYEYYIP